MRRFAVLIGLLSLAAAGVWLGLGNRVLAARDGTLPKGAETGLELVVVEAPNCVYCRLFRRDVLPGYQASPRASEVPIRFVDINDLADGVLGLSEPIGAVPTVVLVDGGRERGRIAGYTGPESFFHLVAHLIGRTP